MDLWTLGSTDEESDDVIAILRLSLGAAEQAGVAHPETISALRAWCKIEYERIHPLPPPPERRSPERLSQDIFTALQRSPHWRFWESLQAGQEVRWTGTKSATYTVVDPEPVTYVPETSEHHGRPGTFTRPGAYIELRRKTTGKTFWTHIAKVRPL